MKTILKISTTFFVLAVSVIALYMPATALGINGQNAEKNLVSEYAGERCSTPAKGSGITAGFFRGWEQTPFQGLGDGLMPVERFRCFKSVNDCQDWLKTMRFKYNAKGVDAAMCTKF